MRANKGSNEGSGVCACVTQIVSFMLEHEVCPGMVELPQTHCDLLRGQTHSQHYVSQMWGRRTFDEPVWYLELKLWTLKSTKSIIVVKNIIFTNGNSDGWSW